MDNNKLIPIDSSVALAKTSVALSLTDKLTFNQNRKLVKEIFLMNGPFFIHTICNFYPFKIELIEKYENEWEWNLLIKNENIFWTDELLGKFIEFLSENPVVKINSMFTLPFSKNIIEKYKHELFWAYLSSNEKIEWREEIIDKYKRNWVWGSRENDELAGLSINKKLPWSESFFKKYLKHWDWSDLSRNENFLWNDAIIDKYCDNWNWQNLSQLKSLPWSDSFIEKYIEKWDWSLLSKNSALPWTNDFFYKYIEKWSWNQLSRNPSLQWTDEFLEKNIKRWNWNNLSSNSGLPWSEKIINKYMNKWNWYNLSINSGLPWSRDFVLKYLDLNRSLLFFNKGLEYDLNFLLELVYYYDKNYISPYKPFQLNYKVWEVLSPFVDDNLIEEVIEEFYSKF